MDFGVVWFVVGSALRFCVEMVLVALTFRLICATEEELNEWAK